MPTVRSVARELPPYYADQEQVIAALREAWGRQHHNVDRLESLHRAVGVGGRHFALPMSEYEGITSFRARNDAWTRCAVDLGERAVAAALAAAGLEARDVSHLFFVTITGLATPSIEARLCNRLPFPGNVRRTPIFGLGCVAGAAGLARMSDWLLAFPDRHAVLLAVELCSLTLQREDLSVANLIASGLFGDGAAAVVMSGSATAGASVGGGPRPRVVATTASFYRDTERVMGWDFVDSGFKLVLSAKVPDVVREHVRHDVDTFLHAHGLARADIAHWVVHTGGPKVLTAFEEALELRNGELARSWQSLREVGNLSSASVLFVLADLLASGEAKPGEHGLLMAMGPGFCAELVLLRW